jgi:hypothetical protein
VLRIATLDSTLLERRRGMNEAFNHLTNELTKARARGHLRTGLALFGFAVFVEGTWARIVFCVVAGLLVMSFLLVYLLRSRQHQNECARRVVQFLMQVDIDNFTMFLAFVALGLVLLREDSFSLQVAGALVAYIGFMIVAADFGQRLGDLRKWVAHKRGQPPRTPSSRPAE